MIKTVSNSVQGLEIAKNLLCKHIDEKTVLFLSGGTTPKLLYTKIAIEKKLTPGAVAMVDERFGDPGHQNSNEKMIKDSGLLSYLEKNKIPFHGILQQDRHSGDSERSVEDSRIPMVQRDSGQARMTLEQEARAYEETIGNLFSDFPKRIAVMGIGEDGHTASLRAGVPHFAKASRGKQNSNYVAGVKDFPGEFKKRITLTFKVLSKMDLLIVLVFGSAKKNALSLMLTPGSEQEIPARFYAKHAITEKTILITDQKV